MKVISKKTFSRIILCLTLFLVIASAKAQPFYTIPKLSNVAEFKNNLSNTAWLLKTGNANKTEIRILIYGQSISVQTWWQDVEKYFKKTYPHLNIQVTNKAIGGFSSDRLKLVVDNDVISTYPDLILFHDYGGEPDYETIIQTIRKRTTAEIALQSDHMADQSQAWHDQHSQVFLPTMCRKYGLAFIDVRTAWKDYLKSNNLKISDLLVDGVHLNDHGNYLMAGIVTKYLDNLKSITPVSKFSKMLKPGKDFIIKNNTTAFSANGNRVDIIWKAGKAGGKPLTVLVDKRNPSGLTESYYYSRPSFHQNYFYLERMGQLLAMSLNTHNEESWMLTVLDVDSISQNIHFSIKGSVTGEDGTGNSNSAFVSKSGKICINPEGWFKKNSPGDFSNFNYTKAGDILYWEVKAMSKDQVKASAASSTIVQGLANQQHQLQLKGESINNIQAIKVYQPPVK